MALGFRAKKIVADKILMLFDGGKYKNPWNYYTGDQGSSTHSLSPNMYLNGDGGYYKRTCYSQLVDFTKYKKLCFQVVSAGRDSSDGDSDAAVGYSTKAGAGSYFSDHFSGGNYASPYSGQLVTLDISNISGSRYVKVAIGSGNRRAGTITVSKIWLEK